MIQVHLPDGSARELDPGSSAADLASQIGPGLAKAAVAAVVDEQICDLGRPLPDGAKVRLLTKRDPEALEILRHSAAHLMADAILRIFPAAQLTIGPVVEDGFYYDIYLPDGTLTPEEFPQIETEMKRLAKEAHPRAGLCGVCEIRAAALRHAAQSVCPTALGRLRSAAERCHGAGSPSNDCARGTPSLSRHHANDGRARRALRHDGSAHFRRA